METYLSLLIINTVVKTITKFKFSMTLKAVTAPVPVSSLSKSSSSLSQDDMVKEFFETLFPIQFLKWT